MWEKWVHTAVLGTDRGALPSAEGRLAPDTESEEEALLREVAALVVYRKAATPLPDPEAVSLPEVPPAHAAGPEALGPMLQVVLSGRFEPALRECVQLVWGREAVWPPYLLPGLFDEAMKESWLFDWLFGRLSPAQAWLARLHPEWRQLAPEADPPPAGMDAEGQMLLLRYCRLQGARERAEDLFEQQLGEAPWRDRKTRLNAWAYHLAPADEAFLKKRLKDSRKEIRRQAAELLLQLPESALSLQLESELGSWQEKHGPDRKTIRALQHEDPWKPLGLFSGSPRAVSEALGRRMAPERWVKPLGVKGPEEVPAKLGIGRAGEAVLKGLLKNESLLRNPNYAGSLFRYLLASGPAGWLEWPGCPDFLRAVPEEEVHAFLQEYLHRSSGWVEENSLPAYLLELGAHRLDDHSAIQIVRHFQALFQDGTTLDWRIWHYRALLRQCAYVCPPSVFRKLRRGWAYVPESWQREVDHFLQILDFRRGLYEALSNKTSV